MSKRPNEAIGSVYERPVDVFLGGSCNPTKWRKDICIPMLQTAEMSFYNPQVDEWYEELIEVEVRAKERAEWLFIVIENETRSIVSLHEAIESILSGRLVVLVLQFLHFGIELEGQMLSEDEVEDYNMARRRLQTLAQTMGVPLYENVYDAVQYIIQKWRQKRRSFSIGLHETSRSLRRNGHQRIRSNSLSSVALCKEMNSNVQFDSKTRQNACFVIQQFAPCPSWKSVLFGGVRKGTKWRQIVQLLQDVGLPFSMLSDDCGARQRGELDIRWRAPFSIQSLQLILFVISGVSRSIDAMAKAVELVHSECALILVVEQLHERETMENGSILSGREFKDLVRARAYLREMALRKGIHLFGSVPEAISSITGRPEHRHVG